MLAGPDSDGDGLGDYVELCFSSNPNNPDTDGDGMSDLVEVNLGTGLFATDTDDGLSDVDELTILHTNPIYPDTDWDGVNDGNEVPYYFGKDPRHLDFS